MNRKAQCQQWLWQYSHGATLQEIADENLLTRQRVHQLLHAHCGPEACEAARQQCVRVRTGLSTDFKTLDARVKRADALCQGGMHPETAARTVGFHGPLWKARRRRNRRIPGWTPGSRRRITHYAPEERLRIVRAAKALHGQGKTWRQAATALGIRPHTLNNMRIQAGRDFPEEFPEETRGSRDAAYAEKLERRRKRDTRAWMKILKDGGTLEDVSKAGDVEKGHAGQILRALYPAEYEALMKHRRPQRGPGDTLQWLKALQNGVSPTDLAEQEKVRPAWIRKQVARNHPEEWKKLLEEKDA